MSDIPNITSVVNSATELLDDIRGGAITRMKAQHEQALDNFDDEKAQKLNEFNQEKAQAFAAADSQLQQRRAAVDAVLADVTKNTDFFVLHFDKAIHSQASLNPTIDPNDESKTQWLRVPSPDTHGNHGHAYAGTKTEVVLPRAYTRPAGYPDYTVDKSYTFMQFVLASYQATSEQINTAIAQQNIELYRAGEWGDGARVEQAPVIDISGLHNYKVLYVRFFNIPFGGGQVPQNVIEYGGNPSFCVDRVINFYDVPA